MIEKSTTNIIATVIIIIIIVGGALLVIMDVSEVFPNIGEPIIMKADDEIDQYNFPGNGTEEDPYIISNRRIFTSQNYCIYIRKTTKFFVIENCFFKAKSVCVYLKNVARNSIIIRNNIFMNFIGNGIVILYSNSIKVENNVFMDFEGVAIATDYSHYCFIENNDITARNITQWGMGIWTSGEGTKVIGNVIKNINHGIYAFGNHRTIISRNSIIRTNFGLYLSHLLNSNITDNILTDIKEIGLFFHHSGLNEIFNNSISSCQIGLECFGSYLMNIYNNSITNNELGAFLYNEAPVVISYIHSYNISLFKNTFRGNIEYGLAIGNYTYDFTIYLNLFENNNLGISQAFDEGIRTIWYNISTLIGNYWNDWSGIGTYSIKGSSNSEDLYPLSNPPF
jgi:parallel beta-helix repeat protein